MPKWQDAPLVEETQPKWETAPIVGEEPQREQFIPGLTAFPVEGERVGIWGVRFPRQLDALFSGMEKLDQILPPEASMEFGRVVGLASDPQKLKDDTEAAILYSVEMDAPFEESFGLINEINKISLREQGSSALKRIHQRYNAGKAALTLGDIGMETLLKTWADPVEFDKRLKEIQQLQSQIAPDAGYEWRSFWEKNFQEAAEQIPNMAVAFERGSKWGILGGFAGAIMGGYAGGPAGAVKGGQLGLTLLSAAGGASRIYELEAGQQFVSMMQMRDEKGNRIDPRLAVLASHAVGALNGGIEVLQWTTALKAFGISGEVFQKASQAVTKKLFTEKSLQGVLAQGTARFGFALTLETGQEVWQESNNIVFDELAKELNNRMKGTGFKRVTAEELKARYIEITEKSLRSFGVILAPGVGLYTALMALKVREGLKIDAERNRPIRVYRRAMGGLKATPEGKQLGEIVVERYPLKPPVEGQETETEIELGLIEKLVDKPIKADEVITEKGEVIEAKDFRSKLSQENRDALAEVEQAEKDGLLSKEEAEELRGAFRSLAEEELVSAEKPPQVTPTTGVTPEIPETQIAPGARTVPPTGETVARGVVQPPAAGMAAPEAAQLYHYTDTEITGGTLKAGQPHEQNYFGEGIYLTEKGQFPGRYEYPAEVPPDLKILDLTSERAYEKFRDDVAAKIGMPVYRSGQSLYDDLRYTAANSPNETQVNQAIRKAVSELTKDYDAIKAPYFGTTEKEDSFELVIKRESVSKTAEAGPGAGAVYYRGDEGERTEGLIPLTDDKDVAAAYLRGGTFETAEEAERYFESGQREKDLQRIKAYRVSPKNTLIIDEKGLKIINSLNDMGDPIAARIIQSKELLYWWRNTKPETQKVWQNILIPQLRKLGYDSIEYQDDPMTGRTLAVFGIESLFPAVQPPAAGVAGAQGKPETNINKATTGKPFSGSMFVGTGRETVEQVYEEHFAREPIFGRAIYSTPKKSFAVEFGPNVEKVEVNLKNPLVIKTDAEWLAITKEAGLRSYVPIDSEEVAKLRQAIQNKGHDGVIIKITGNEANAKKLLNAFEEDTVVDLTQTQEEALEKQRTERIAIREKEDRRRILQTRLEKGNLPVTEAQLEEFKSEQWAQEALGKREGEKAEAKRIISKEAYEAAKKRLTDPGMMRIGIGPKDLADLITVGAYHIESGLRTFAAWSKKMIEEFGETIRPQLQTVWDNVHTLTKESRAKAVRQRVKDKIAEAKTVRKIEQAEPGTKSLPVEEPIEKHDKLPSLTAARNEAMQADRELLGLDNLASPERIGWQRTLAEAKEQGLDEKAMRIASEIIVNPRTLTPVETAGLVLKAARLKNEYDSVATKVRNATDPAETIIWSNEAERIEAEFDILTRAIKMAGTDTGRALVARKLTINRNYDLVSVINRAKVKKQKTLTAQERTEFTDMVTKLQERDNHIAELQEQNDRLIAEQAVKPEKRKTRWSQMTLEQKDTELMADIAEVRELLRAGC